MYRCHVRVSEVGARLVPFEDAVAKLGQLPRLFVEPDGAFVWTSPPDAASRWQVEGCLVDGGERLLYVELKGLCPVEHFDELLHCCAPPDADLSFEFIQQGVVVGASEFRRIAARSEELPPPRSP